MHQKNVEELIEISIKKLSDIYSIDVEPMLNENLIEFTVKDDNNVLCIDIVYDENEIEENYYESCSDIEEYKDDEILLEKFSELISKMDDLDYDFRNSVDQKLLLTFEDFVKELNGVYDIISDISGASEQKRNELIDVLDNVLNKDDKGDDEIVLERYKKRKDKLQK